MPAGQSYWIWTAATGPVVRGRAVPAFEFLPEETSSGLLAGGSVGAQHAGFIRFPRRLRRPWDPKNQARWPSALGQPGSYHFFSLLSALRADGPSPIGIPSRLRRSTNTGHPGGSPRWAVQHRGVKLLSGNRQVMTDRRCWRAWLKCDGLFCGKRRPAPSTPPRTCLAGH